MNNRNNAVMHEFNNFGHETFVWGIGEEMSNYVEEVVRTVSGYDLDW